MPVTFHFHNINTSKEKWPKGGVLTTYVLSKEAQYLWKFSTIWQVYKTTSFTLSDITQRNYWKRILPKILYVSRAEGFAIVFRKLLEIDVV